MSDYISKREALEIIEKETKRTNSIIEHNTQLHIKIALEKLPTVDEKEIIRKTVERIVERLEGKKWGIHDWRDKWRNEIIGECIEVVKEEGGIE